MRLLADRASAVRTDLSHEGWWSPEVVGQENKP